MRLSEINEGQIFAPCEAISFVLVTSTPQSLFEPPSKGKGANEPKAHTAGAYTDFRRHEACLGVLLLPPGRDTSPSQGYPPVVCRRYPFIHLGEERQSGAKFLV